MATTFGKVIADARKARGMGLRELAEKVKKEDGDPISLQYLNDIEHGRRNPPTEPMIRQLAKALAIPEQVDYLLMLATNLPEQDQKLVRSSDPRQVTEALQAFRKKLGQK